MKSLIYLLIGIVLLGCDSGTSTVAYNDTKAESGTCEAFVVSDLDTNIIVTEDINIDYSLYDSVSGDYHRDTVSCADHDAIRPDLWVFDGTSCVEIGYIDNGCTVIKDSVAVVSMYEDYHPAATDIFSSITENMSPKYIHDESTLDSYMRTNPTTKMFSTQLSCQIAHRDCNQEIKYDIYPSCGYYDYPVFSETNIDTAGLGQELYTTVERMQEIISSDEWIDPENGYSAEYPAITS